MGNSPQLSYVDKTLPNDTSRIVENQFIDYAKHLSGAFVTTQNSLLLFGVDKRFIDAIQQMNNYVKRCFSNREIIQSKYRENQYVIIKNVETLRHVSKSSLCDNDSSYFALYFESVSIVFDTILGLVYVVEKPFIKRITKYESKIYILYENGDLEKQINTLQYDSPLATSIATRNNAETGHIIANNVRDFIAINNDQSELILQSDGKVILNCDDKSFQLLEEFFITRIVLNYGQFSLDGQKDIDKLYLLTNCGDIITNDVAIRDTISGDMEPIENGLIGPLCLVKTGNIKRIDKLSIVDDVIAFLRNDNFLKIKIFGEVRTHQLEDMVDMFVQGYYIYFISSNQVFSLRDIVSMQFLGMKVADRVNTDKRVVYSDSDDLPIFDNFYNSGLSALRTKNARS